MAVRAYCMRYHSYISPLLCVAVREHVSWQFVTIVCGSNIREDVAVREHVLWQFVTVVYGIIYMLHHSCVLQFVTM